MKTFIALACLALLSGCYTQLMTYSDARQAFQPNIQQPADSTADSINTEATENQDTNTPGVTNQQQGCNCSEFERMHDLCWCICDRCGTYHRFGYQYCPSRFYNSYWGWDYYYEHPWWYNSYYRSSRGYYDNRNRYYSHDDYYHNYGSPSAPAGSSLPRTQEKPKKNRGMVDPVPSSSTLNKPVIESPQPAAQQPASQSSGSNGESSSPPPSKPVQTNTKDKPQKNRGQVDE